jgi:DNA-repair protein XRCC1
MIMATTIVKKFELYFIDCCRAQEKAKRRESNSKKDQSPTTKPSPAPSPTKTPSKNSNLDIFDDSTDEDEPATGGAETNGTMDGNFEELPDFFSDKHFFFYGDFAAPERRLLTRYIAAYDG